jgi:protein tyrosine/serine phosphatase
VIRKLHFATILVALLICGCVSVPVNPDSRPSKWAQPVPAKYLANFNKVSDNLYRSAQPDENGLREAQSLGIHTIIDLQESPHQDPVTSDTQGMIFERIPQYAWWIEDQNIAKFLSLVKNEKNGPFLVHCLHGSDRTGVACAMYRIVIQGWIKKDAIDEMKHGGYGFHPVWMNIPDYIEDVDIEKIKVLMLLQDIPEGFSLKNKQM